MNTVTPVQVKAALRLTMIVAEGIREAGQIPSGHLYAVLSGVVDLHGYEKIVETLVRAGLVRKEGSMLHWVCPKSKQ
jgi:hypothetical protein